MSEQQETQVLESGSSQPAPRNEQHAAHVALQNALQWLARVTQSYTVDHELRLFFDPEGRRFLTPDLGRETRLGLSLPGLVLQFLEKGTPTPHPLDVDGRSSTEVEAWMLAELLHRGFDRSVFNKHLPYEWDGPMSGDEVKYAAHRLSEALGRLTQELVEAAACLRQARRIENRGESVAEPDNLLYWPAKSSMGFTLPFETAIFEVVYESEHVENKHYRVSRLPFESAPSADLRIAKPADVGICPAQQISDAVNVLAPKLGKRL